MFVQATPKSELKQLYDVEIRKRNMKIKVVERSGMRLKDYLQKKDISGVKQCDDECFVCKTSQKGDCMSSSITYRIQCGFEHPEGTYEYNGKSAKKWIFPW